MNATVPFRANSDLLDAKYLEWKADPAAVDATWASFFEGFELGLAELAKRGGRQAPAADGLSEETLSFRMRVTQALLTFRRLGHTAAHLDPLSPAGPDVAGLSPEGLGFSPAELDQEVRTFERFLHRRFVGQKRFSVEGGESMLVALETILESLPALGGREIVMGMAHRGRLSVLANFLQKPLETLFYEFSENYVPNMVAGDGDVKYHLGFETVRQTRDGREVAVMLAANPSHLEAVDPVVEGMARARQRFLGDTTTRNQVCPVLIHGDAAFAGQGIVAEVLNLSQLPGYRTGGTIHIVVNNQIGFTTLPADARSSHYCTDVAKMIDAPVFHVNGDCPLEVMPWPSWPWSSASSSAATSSSTSSATAARPQRDRRARLHPAEHGAHDRRSPVAPRPVPPSS
jgi:2-oxoglutarate dehydrogenase complex dehydrogenase (E1) component-like enzyme